MVGITCPASLSRLLIDACDRAQSSDHPSKGCSLGYPDEPADVIRKGAQHPRFHWRERSRLSDGAQGATADSMRQATSSTDRPVGRAPMCTWVVAGYGPGVTYGS
jgi:hypothetical protein